MPIYEDKFENNGEVLLIKLVTFRKSHYFNIIGITV